MKIFKKPGKTSKIYKNSFPYVLAWETFFPSLLSPVFPFLSSLLDKGFKMTWGENKYIYCKTDFKKFTWS